MFHQQGTKNTKKSLGHHNVIIDRDSETQRFGAMDSDDQGNI
jgi:hypothetical protein